MLAFMIRGYQLKAALPLVDMTARELAEAAKISPTGLTAIMSGASDPKSKTLDRIVRALEERGAMFLDEADGLGAGVRLRKPKSEA